MHRDGPPLGLTCPLCGSELVPSDDGEPGEVHRLACDRCGGSFVARPKKPKSPIREPKPATVGGLNLRVRAGLLRLAPPVYGAGLGIGVTGMVALGGFVPLIRGWLYDSGKPRRGVIEAMGGIRIPGASSDPDSDLGPILRRQEAPGIFDEVARIAGRQNTPMPDEVRLSFLPCCGVVAWRHSNCLLLGLPLLHVLTLAEFRAVVAHELAHLARGDARRAAGSLRFVEGLGRALDDPSSRSRSPLRLWARACRSAALALIGPIARGQEARADEAAARIAGGGMAASALVKVAMVQPIFRELLAHVGPGRAAASNLYATFRELWARIPDPLMEAMRLATLVRVDTPTDSPHPALPDRVAALVGKPSIADAPSDTILASTLLGDLEWLEQMLHDRLYRNPDDRAERLPSGGVMTDRQELKNHGRLAHHASHRRQIIRCKESVV